ncbi:MAG: hypothetical protein EBX47_10540 [Synechococcaceae bacterium WB8_1B_057]|nr:hypothetical protein [Synechococcaceae bacterium WB6_1A_059]NDG79848.1 hypothetical protein [Synechococcaceae bacterium WB8_1B_057]
MEKKFTKKFEPLSQNATNKINELISRDGKLIVETKTFVEIQRYESVAKIDQWGRVEWRPV